MIDGRFDQHFLELFAHESSEADRNAGRGLAIAALVAAIAIFAALAVVRLWPGTGV